MQRNFRRNISKNPRVHDLPRIHKEFAYLPKFRPIVDTTGTVHYYAGKNLSELFNPLTD